jgi:hypothetical protein
MSARKRAQAKNRAIAPAPYFFQPQHLSFEPPPTRMIEVDLPLNLPVQCDVPTALKLARDILKKSGWTGTMTIR